MAVHNFQVINSDGGNPKRFDVVKYQNCKGLSKSLGWHKAENLTRNPMKNFWFSSLLFTHAVHNAMDFHTDYCHFHYLSQENQIGLEVSSQL